MTWTLYLCHNVVPPAFQSSFWHLYQISRIIIVLWSQEGSFEKLVIPLTSTLPQFISTVLYEIFSHVVCRYTEWCQDTCIRCVRYCMIGWYQYQISCYPLRSYCWVTQTALKYATSLSRLSVVPNSVGYNTNLMWFQNTVLPRFPFTSPRGQVQPIF